MLGLSAKSWRAPQYKFLEPPRCPTSVQSNDESVMSLSDIEKTTVMSSENGKELNDTEKVVNKPLEPSVGSRCESDCLQASSVLERCITQLVETCKQQC